jgi:hypothetical protein
MKRAGILGLTIALTLGLGVSASQAAKAKKIESEVEFEGWYYPPPEFDFTLVGDVASRKNKCEKGRTVTILGLEDETDDGIPEGSASTDQTGDFEFNAEENSAFEWHAAEVERRKITKPNGKKLVCKADRSPAFFVD